MRAVVLAGVLGFLLFECVSLLQPLKSVLSVFHPWERHWVIGLGCAAISSFTVLVGREMARRNKWRADVCTVASGIGLAILLIPKERFGEHSLHVPLEYSLATIELALIFAPAALAAHLLAPNKSVKRTRDE
jgi:hypothetical protein